LRREGQVVGIYQKALRLLLEIVKQSPHSVIIKSDIVVDLVGWLSPRHSITDEACKKFVFEICQLIAQKSDDGRQALVDANVVPELSILASSQTAIEVVSACKILKALAHSGKFGNFIISAGLKKVMENITSPVRRSTLHSKEDKRLAQASAKEVLETMKLSKRHESIGKLAQTTTAPRSPSTNSVTTHRSVFENQLPEELPEPRIISSVRRSVSVRDTRLSPEPSSPASEGLPEPEPNTFRHIQHTRSFSEPDQHSYSRYEGGARLSAVHEDEVGTIEEENFSSSTPQRRIVRRQTQDDDNLNRHNSTSSFSTATDETFVNPNPRKGTSTLIPPSYKSVSGSIRRELR